MVSNIVVRFNGTTQGIRTWSGNTKVGKQKLLSLTCDIIKIFLFYNFKLDSGSKPSVVGKRWTHSFLLNFPIPRVDLSSVAERWDYTR